MESGIPSSFFLAISRRISELNLASLKVFGNCSMQFWRKPPKNSHSQGFFESSFEDFIGNSSRIGFFLAMAPEVFLGIPPVDFVRISPVVSNSSKDVWGTSKNFSRNSFSDFFLISSNDSRNYFGNSTKDRIENFSRVVSEIEVCYYIRIFLRVSAKIPPRIPSGVPH